MADNNEVGAFLKAQQGVADGPDPDGSEGDVTVQGSFERLTARGTEVPPLRQQGVAGLHPGDGDVREDLGGAAGWAIHRRVIRGEREHDLRKGKVV